jgi:hypothetical protein
MKRWQRDFIESSTESMTDDLQAELAKNELFILPQVI